jgi:uncharacterized protein YggU (UPF0235/DUF167 family)
MKSIKKVLAMALALAMVVTAVPVTSAQAASTAKLSKSSVTVAVGAKAQTKTVKVTTPSAWKSVKVTVSQTAASKKIAKATVSGKTVKVKAVKKGSTKVTVKVTAKKNGKAVTPKKLTLNVKTVTATLTVASSSVSVKEGATSSISVKKVPSTAQVTYTSADPSVATVSASGVVTGVKAGKTTITVASDYKKVTRSVDVEVTSDEAQVTKVEALSATRVKVTFSEAISKDDVDTNYATLFSIGGDDPAAAEVSDDAKSVELTFDKTEVERSADATVIVQPIITKADATKKTALYSGVFAKYADTVAPTLVSAEATIGGTAKETDTVVLTFSEPVAKPSVRINGTTIASSKVAVDTNPYKVNVTTTVKEGETYTVDVYNITDLATNANVTAQNTATLNITVDRVAPTVTASAEGDNKVVLTFSKEMNSDKVNAAITAAANLVKDSKNADLTYTVDNTKLSTDKKVTLTITGSLYSSDSTTAVANVFIPLNIEDKVGNVLVGGYTTQVSFTQDKTAPAYQSYEVVEADGKIYRN